MNLMKEVKNGYFEFNHFSISVYFLNIYYLNGKPIGYSKRIKKNKQLIQLFYL